MAIKRATRASPVAIKPPARGEKLEEYGAVTKTGCIVVLIGEVVGIERIASFVNQSVFIVVRVLLSVM